MRNICISAILFLLLVLANPCLAETKLPGHELIKSRFNLTDQYNNAVSEKDYFGRYALIFFGFTHCPKICPLGLNTVANTLKALGEQSSKVTPLFISIDPKRDTPERLTSYLKNFDSQIIGLTGSRDQIDQATASFRAYYAQLAGATSETYSFDHSSVIYFMDPRGVYVNHFPSTLGSEEIAKQIKEVLNK